MAAFVSASAIGVHVSANPVAAAASHIVSEIEGLKIDSQSTT
jgi:hypothetical protein